jgi:DNA-binding PadR family transcriptional regulator
MARTSQTQIAVLGALSIEPMTGYALRQAIVETLGHFWSESYGQIYPTLARLEEQGLVTRGAAGATSGSVFAITPQGVERLRELLAEPIAPVPPRNGLLLRLFFGRHLGLPACRRILQEALVGAEDAMARMSAIRAEVESEPDSPDRPYWLLTVSAGQHTARAQLDWIRESLTLLADVEHADPGVADSPVIDSGVTDPSA